MTETPRGPGGSDRLRNIKLTVEYEGTAYHGWQNQRDRSSVQGELERAIGKLVNHPVVLHGSGRTDRGVHALGQVANFHTPRDIPAAKLLLGINTYLPEDIRVREVEEVDPEFHSRYSARGKQYRYVILRARGRDVRTPSVLVRRFSTEVPFDLDVDRMRRGAEFLPGMRDFRAFESYSRRKPPRPGDAPRSTVRTVLAVTVREVGPFVLIDAFGRGFLYSMVRTIAGTLIEIGKGVRSPEQLGEVLLSGDRRRAGFTAAPQGLCLVEVFYRDEALARAIRAVGEGPADVPQPVAWEGLLFKLLS